MVRSKSTALVTTVIALLLVVAVALALIFTVGDASYAPEDSAVSNTAVSTQSSAGSVSSDYLYKTLLSMSARSDGQWQQSDIVTEDGNSVYTTSMTGGAGGYTVYLITQSGAKPADQTKDGSYLLTYNGQKYRFNGVTYINYAADANGFMRNAGIYRNSKSYGLIVETDKTIEYNPNDVYRNLYFNAVLDGAGATIKPTQVMKSWRDWNSGSDSGKNVDYDFIANGYLGADNTNRCEYGINVGGVVFGSLENGTMKNFIYDDSAAQAVDGEDRHYNYLKGSRVGSAVGGLVGYAGPSTSGGSAVSNIYNIQMNMYKSFYQTIEIDNDSAAAAKLDHYIGGLIGLNLSANIELVTLNYNDVVLAQDAGRYGSCGVSVWPSYSGAKTAENNRGTAFAGGLVGLQHGNHTLSKISITGTTNSGIKLDDKPLYVSNLNEWTRVATYMGGFFGGTIASEEINLDGLIYSFRIDNIYYWNDNSRASGTEAKRGIIVGKNFDAKINYSDLYITDKLFEGTTYEGSVPNIDSIGNGQEYRPNNTVFGAYNITYAFDGNEAGNVSFTYADSSLLSNIQFSQDPNYMIEVTPVASKGILWQVDWKTSKSNQVRYSTSFEAAAGPMNDPTYMQNNRENVKLKSWKGFNGTYSGTGYLKMEFTMGATSEYTVWSNTPDKVYDGNPLSYPYMDFFYTVDGEPGGYNGLQETYFTVENGQIKFYNKADGSAAPVNVTAYYNEAGARAFDASKMFARVQVYENGEYRSLNSKDEAVNVGQYRWRVNVDDTSEQISQKIAIVFTDGEGITRRFLIVPMKSEEDVNITAKKLNLTLKSDAFTFTGKPMDFKYDQNLNGQYTYKLDGLVDGDIGMVTPSANVYDSANKVVQPRNAGTYSLRSTSLTGEKAANYSINANIELTVNPVNVTITPYAGASVNYGDKLSQDAFSSVIEYSLAFEGELTDFADDGVKPLFNIKTADGKYMFAKDGNPVYEGNMPAGDYVIEYDKLGAPDDTIRGNYNVTFNNASSVVVNIAKRQLSAVIPSVSDAVYGDTVSIDRPSLSGLAEGDTFTSHNYAYTLNGEPVGEIKNAGNYTVTLTEGGITIMNGTVDASANYDIVSSASQFRVNPRDTVVKFSDYDSSLTYSYKGDEYTFSGVVVNPAYGEVPTVTFKTYSDVNHDSPVVCRDAGLYFVGAELGAEFAGNYNITGLQDVNGLPWTEFELDKVNVTINLPLQSYEFSGSAIAYPLSRENLEGVLADEDYAGLLESAVLLYNGAAEAVNAGTYNVTVNIPQSGNYNGVTFNASALTITPMNIEYVVTGESEGVLSREYAASLLPSIGYKLQGVTNKEADLSSLNTVVTFRKNGETVTTAKDAGDYEVVLEYKDGGNYVNVSHTFTLRITPKTITLTVYDADNSVVENSGTLTLVYNKSQYVPDYVLNGVIPGDVVDVAFRFDGNAEAPVNAGSYAVTTSISNANYALASFSYILQIDPYTLKVEEDRTSLLLNKQAAMDYYYDLMNYHVYDADGTLMEGVNMTKQIKQGGEVVSSITAGGAYTGVLTFPTLELGSNYTVPSKAYEYQLYVYEVSLSAIVNYNDKAYIGNQGQSPEIVYGGEYNVSYQLYAFISDNEYALGTVGKNGQITFDGAAQIDGVASVDTAAPATLNISGAALDDSPFNADAQGYDNIRQYTGGPVNSGSYSATYTFKINVTGGTVEDYSFTLTSHMNFNIVPANVDVTLSAVDTYYTETVTEEILKAGVGVEETYNSKVKVESDVLGSAPNAGSYNYTVSSSDYNYVFVPSGEGKINVNALKAVITVENLSKQYGEAILPDVKATVAFFKGEEPYEYTDVKGEISYSAVLEGVETGSPVGEYLQTLSLNASATDNFTVEVIKGDLTITPREVTVQWNPYTMVYGSAAPGTPTYTLTAGSWYDSQVTLLPENPVINSDGSLVFNKLDVSGSPYTVVYGNVNVLVGGEVSNNYKVTAGEASLTVTPYVLTGGSYVLKSGETLVYNGSVFANDLYSYSVATPNGDKLAFNMNYSGEVKNAGNYTVNAVLATVNDDAGKIGNYDTSRIARHSFTIEKARFVLDEINAGSTGAEVTFENGVWTLSSYYTGAGVNLADAGIVLSFSDGHGGSVTYDAGQHGAVSTSMDSYSDELFLRPVEAVNAGTYFVRLAVSESDNFEAAVFGTNGTILYVINKAIIEDIDSIATVIAPVSPTYDGGRHEVTLQFTDGNSYDYIVDYRLSDDIGAETVNPVNAGDYFFYFTIENDNFYYKSSAAYNSFTIQRSSNVEISVWVDSTLTNINGEMYYTGAKQTPVVSVKLNTPGSTTQASITVKDGFRFVFYNVASSGTAVPGYDGYFYSGEPMDYVTDPGKYYVQVIFNEENEGVSPYPNYNPVNSFYTVNGVLKEFVIAKGIMSMSVSANNATYNGMIGIDGFDMIYQDGGNWFINENVIRFSGVDVQNMMEARFGNLVITVSYQYGEDDVTGEPLYSKLYYLTWDLAPDGKTRLTPGEKVYYTEIVTEDGKQTEGPVGNVKDMLLAGTYKIDVTIDNTNNAFYESATIYDPESESYTNVAHAASGTVTIGLADVEFSMQNTSSYYDSGRPVIGSDYVKDEDYLFRGVQVDPGKGYAEGSFDGENYEIMSADDMQITVTDAEGNPINYADIVNAGNYYFTFTFNGITGKYNPFTSGKMLYAVAKAEYHITVTPGNPEGYVVEFGTQFNEAIAMDYKLEIDENGGNTTDTGTYEKFVDAYRNFIADPENPDKQAEFEKYVSIEQEGSDYEGYTNEVGNYYIYYVIRSKDANLDLGVENSGCFITVVKSAPTLITYGDVPVTGTENAVEAVSYNSLTDWNSYIISRARLGLEYNNGTAPTGEYYYTGNLVISNIEKEGEGVVSRINAVGTYIVTLQPSDEERNLKATDGNLLRVKFVVEKIDATLEIVSVPDGQIYNDADFQFEYVIKDSEGTNITSSYSGTVNIAFTLDGESVDKIRDAGNYTLTISATGSENYSDIAQVETTFTIKQAELYVHYTADKGGYNELYKKEGFTLPDGAYFFSRDGITQVATDPSKATAYYVEGAQTADEIQTIVAAYDAYRESAGAEALAFDQWFSENSATYGTYTLTTSVSDVSLYYVIVVYTGDKNYVYSATNAVSNSNPSVNISQATVKPQITLNENAGVSVIYRDAILSEITGDMSKYFTITWDNGMTSEELNAQIKLVDNNVYTVGTPVGKVNEGYRVEITAEHRNYLLSYSTVYVPVIVNARPISIDLNSDISVFLQDNPEAVYRLTNSGDKLLSFDLNYDTKTHGPLTVSYDVEEYKDIINIVLSNGLLATTAYPTAGEYSTKVNIEVTDSNYVLENAESFKDMQIRYVINKAEIKIDVNTVEYNYKPDGKTFKDAYDPVSGIYTMLYHGLKFDINKRLTFSSEGIFEGRFLNEIGDVNLTVTDTSKAAVGEYTITISDKSSTNYTISGGEFVIKLNVVPSDMVEVVYTGASEKSYDATALTATDFKNSKDFAVKGMIWSQGSDPTKDAPVDTNLNEAVLKDHISVYFQKQVNGEWQNYSGSILDVGNYRVYTRVETNDSYTLSDTLVTEFVVKRGTPELQVNEKNNGIYTYTGNKVVPEFELKALFGGKVDTAVTYSFDTYSDESCTKKADILNAGTYYAKITVDSSANSNYNTVSQVLAITVNKVALNDKNIKLAYTQTYAYTGKPITVQDVVLTFNGVPMTEGKDYEVICDGYTATTSSAPFTVRALAEGNFSGEISATYKIGASVALSENATITYGDTQVSVAMTVPSLGGTSLGDDVINVTFRSAKLFDAEGKLISILILPEKLVITQEMIDSGFTATFKGLGKVDAGVYTIQVEYTTEYQGITAAGNTADDDVAYTVTVQPNTTDVAFNATVMQVNGNNIKINIDGVAGGYAYSMDGGATWNTLEKNGEYYVIGSLNPSTTYDDILIKVDDANYAIENPTIAHTGALTTSADVQSLIDRANAVAAKFTLAKIDEYNALIAEKNSISTYDYMERAEEIELAYAEMKAAYDGYINDLREAVASANDSTEKISGKALNASAGEKDSLANGFGILPVLGLGAVLSVMYNRKKEEKNND